MLLAVELTSGDGPTLRTFDEGALEGGVPAARLCAREYIYI